MIKLEKEFTNISTQIKREIEEFDLQRVRDFKTIVIKYIEDQMAHQNQVNIFLFEFLFFYLLKCLFS